LEGEMSIKPIVLAATFLVLSTSVNAVVLNTLNDVDYEWLELTATQGLSRSDVERRLADVNDDLYGYEYASRQLVSDLFLSYVPWDGDVIGELGAPDVVSGYASLMNDFGILTIRPGDGIDETVLTNDLYRVEKDGTQMVSTGLLGSADDVICGYRLGDSGTCSAYLRMLTNSAGTPGSVRIVYNTGFDTQRLPDTTSIYISSDEAGSFLVRAQVVPIPPAVWLFGSGFLGLIGIARRKARV
jgi:hypothetical protein